MPNTVSDVSRPLPPFERPPKPERRSRVLRLPAVLAMIAAGIIAAGCSSSHSGSLTPQGTHTSGGLKQANNISRALPAASPTPYPAALAACANAAPGPAQASCQVVKQATAATNTPVYGLSPSQLRAAYGLPPLAATPAPGTPQPPGPPPTPNGPLVAVVAAYDDGAAKDDMNKYRQQYGIAQCNDGGPTPCFTKVQLKPTPGAPPPAPKPPGGSVDAVSWADEIALDLAMVSASCPNCRIVLVEALGQDLDSLADAVNTAASYNPVAISNSWGVPEGGGNIPNIDPAAQAAFNHPGIAITASAGDLGTGAVQFPASSPYVTAVGGTTLTPDSANLRGWDESVWSGSGNGCSAMVAVPSWQTATGGCTASGRAIPDVSFLADSTVGVAVFSSAQHGWVAFGGTSVGAPFVAGLYAAANDYGAGTVGAPALYANLSNLNSVTGAPGSPNGLAGF